MSRLSLRVDVPLCSLRPFEARDYQETLPAPPPATVVGMLLSMAGVDGDRVGHFVGNRLGLAIQEEPPVSTVLRKMRRDAASSELTKQGIPQFRPEYQELLSGLTFWVDIERQPDAPEDLAETVRRAIEEPESVDRYGALSLGESAFMVDAVSIVDAPPEDVLVLRPSEGGFLTMPVWTDFQDRSRTELRRFDLVEGELAEDDLVRIGPAEE